MEKKGINTKNLKKKKKKAHNVHINHPAVVAAISHPPPVVQELHTHPLTPQQRGKQ